MQIPNARRWISQSRGSAVLKPQEAFLQLSEAVAVACVMSAAQGATGFPRIPDATPGLKVLGRLYLNIAWIRLVGSEQ